MPKPRKQRYVWKGPEVDGITQSMLSRFMVCRERFRLLTVEGLKPVDRFNHRIEFGNMWHVCEEYQEGDWADKLREYSLQLRARYRESNEQIEKWFNVCLVQFPVYIQYWKEHETEQVKPLLKEWVFNSPFTLPSGRIVRLRGKMDGVDLVGKKQPALYLLEHKTKGEIFQEQLVRQLTFDLQTMLYLTVLKESWYDREAIVGKLSYQKMKLAGIRYNVVRRPLSGGKHTITRLKNVNKGKRSPNGERLPPREESAKEYYGRLRGLISEEPEHYFMRWRVEVTPADLERFKREFLNPILEQLCDWWEAIQECDGEPFNAPTPHQGRHWRTPYGFYNVLAEGGSAELDEYLATGSEIGLQRVQKLFTELEKD